MDLPVDGIKGSDRRDLRIGPSAALSHPEHGSFANRAASRVEFLPFVLVRFLSTNEAFINLDNAAQFVQSPTRTSTATRFTQAPQDEPRAFLSYADLFRQLHRRDSLPRRDEQIHGVDPLVKRNVGPLENRSRADGEVQLASVAAVVSSLPHGDAGRRFALRTKRASGPETAFEVFPRRLFVRENLEQLESADSGLGHLFPLHLRPFPALRTGVATHESRPLALPTTGANDFDPPVPVPPACHLAGSFGEMRPAPLPYLGYFVRGKGLLPIFRAFARDNSADHTKLCRIFHALTGDGQVGAINQSAMLVAKHLITSAFLNVVINQRVPLLGSTFAVRYNGVPARVLVAKFGDVARKVLVRFSLRHRNHPNIHLGQAIGSNLWGVDHHNKNSRRDAARYCAPDPCAASKLFLFALASCVVAPYHNTIVLHSLADVKGVIYIIPNRWILIKQRLQRLGMPQDCPTCKGHGHVFTGPARLDLTLWFLHPRKGCSRGVEVQDIQEQQLPEVYIYLRQAAERNAERFSLVPKTETVYAR